MERPLLFLERILYGNGKEAFNGVFALRLNGTIIEQHLRNALRKVQQKHAVLRAGIVQDTGGMPCFRVFDAVPEIPLLIRGRRDTEHWKDAVKAAWATTFDSVNGPLVQLEWLAGDKQHELILAFHHSICDGGGGLLLIREILALLDEPEKDLGTADGLPGLEMIIPSAVLNSPRQRRRSRMLAMILRTALGLSATFIKADPVKKIPRSTDYLIHRKLTEEQSARLFAVCTARGVTVNTALSLAFLRAFKEVRGKKAFNKITCPVDIRRFVPQLDKESLFSFGLVLTLSLGKDRDQGFWVQAKLLQDKAEQQLKNLKPYDFLMVMERLHPAFKSMIKTLTYGKVSNDLMFSNLGRMKITEQYKDFEVETVFSPTVIGPFANPTTVITSTFGGKLDCSFVSNEQYMKSVEAEQIFETAVGSLNSAMNEVL